MYATIVEVILRTPGSAAAHGHTGRALANALAALPGFLAFLALDTDAASGAVTMLCIFADAAGIEASEREIARWQRDENATTEPCIRRLGAGAVIAQKGL
jgi:hypothetical protein